MTSLRRPLKEQSVAVSPPSPERRVHSWSGPMGLQCSERLSPKRNKWGGWTHRVQLSREGSWREGGSERRAKGRGPPPAWLRCSAPAVRARRGREGRVTVAEMAGHADGRTDGQTGVLGGKGTTSTRHTWRAMLTVMSHTCCGRV